MSSHYVPGQGYLVRDDRGRVVAKGLTREEKDRLMTYAMASMVPQWLLDSLRG